jgi:hypothetical protein
MKQTIEYGLITFLKYLRNLLELKIPDISDL